jgi:hypothetical protein
LLAIDFPFIERILPCLLRQAGFGFRLARRYAYLRPSHLHRVWLRSCPII